MKLSWCLLLAKAWTQDLEMIHPDRQTDIISLSLCFILLKGKAPGDRNINVTVLLRNSYGKFMQNWIPRVMTDSNTGARAMRPHHMPD